MQPPKPASDLSDLRRRVGSLHAVHCGLGHERILRAEGTQRPLPGPHSDHGYERRGLCERSIRERRIGCTHTLARYALRDALAALEQRGESDGSVLLELSRELERLDLSISLLDHRMGAEQLDHARSSEAVDAGRTAADRALARAAQRASAQRIERFASEHDRHLDALVELRGVILALLDEALPTRPEDATC